MTIFLTTYENSQASRPRQISHTTSTKGTIPRATRSAMKSFNTVDLYILLVSARLPERARSHP